MKKWKCSNCFAEKITEDNIVTSVCRCGEYLKEIEKITEINYYPKKENYRNITKKQRYEVLKRQDWKCNICGIKLKYGINSPWEGEIAHIDHIFPYSRRKEYFNGKININELSNLQALCPKCNLKKGDKEVN